MGSGSTKKLQRFAKLCVLGLSIVITACATTDRPQQVDADKTNLRSDMVSDLLSVLPQLLNPSNTSIQFSDTESGDIADAVATLAGFGYGLQRVNADQGSVFLRLTDLPVQEFAHQDEQRLRLSIGSLELTRSYRVVKKGAVPSSLEKLIWRDGRTVIPSGSLFIAGSSLRVQHEGIDVQFSSSVSDDLEPGTFKYIEMALIEGGIPTISLITEDLVRSITSASAAPVLSNLNTNQSSVTNLYNGGTSDFKPFLDDYNRIIREFVIFPNDSQNLGRTGKSLVKAFIAKYSRNTDVIGIIGCSNGPTGVAIGNEGLALGRAKRVVEELTLSGISDDKIFDEGCWSPTVDAQGFPNRGVVLDLYRRAG